MAAEAPFSEDGVVKLAVKQRTGAIVEAVRRLDEAGVGVDDVGLKRPTLDDVFLTLTGHAAEHADGGENGAAPDAEREERR
jgi:ABC-2 type transport system ATP-binding protein